MRAALILISIALAVVAPKQRQTGGQSQADQTPSISNQSSHSSIPVGRHAAVYRRSIRGGQSDENSCLTSALRCLETHKLARCIALSYGASRSEM